jgi:hypothetical protein
VLGQECLDLSFLGVGKFSCLSHNSVTEVPVIIAATEMNLDRSNTRPSKRREFEGIGGYTGLRLRDGDSLPAAGIEAIDRDSVH